MRTVLVMMGVLLIVSMVITVQACILFGKVCLLALQRKDPREILEIALTARPRRGILEA